MKEIKMQSLQVRMYFCVNTKYSIASCTIHKIKILLKLHLPRAQTETTENKARTAIYSIT